MFELLLGGNKKKLPLGPGSQTLANGDASVGYYGAVAAADFMSLAQLRTLTGFTAGTANANWDGKWIKVSIGGKTLLLPSVVLVTSVSRNMLLAKGLVTGTNVTFGGFTYKVRLARISDTDTLTTGIVANFQNIDRNRLEWANSEWGRIVSALLTPAQDTDSPHFLLYPRASTLVPVGTYTMAMETRTGATNVPIAINNNLGSFGGGPDDSGFGWLPVLEVVG